MEFCSNNRIKCHRGSEANVLSRYIEILKDNDFDHVVRLTGDNPLVDMSVLERSLVSHLNSKVDYTSTKGLPIGMNFEICTSAALLSLEAQNLKKADKEHVTLFLKESDSYTTSVLQVDEDENFKKLRLTIDYPSDYLVLSAVFSIADKYKIPIGMDLVRYCKENYSWIFEVNKSNFQKTVYKSLIEEIEAIGPLLEKYDFSRLSSFLNNNK